MRACPRWGRCRGVLADQFAGDFLGVRILARAACALGIAEADTAVTFLGLDLGEQERDFR
jgi:hypothetical protein